MKRLPLEERFWAKVDKTAGCWEWQRSRNADGYGTFGVGRASKLAHRVAWELTRGPIPAGLRILHRCDNPGCVRPEHLFVGTQADNVADAVAKGRARGAVGERNAKAKLTEADIRLIRHLAAYGERAPALAARFEVSSSLINAIIARKRWSHVPDGEMLRFDIAELRRALEQAA